MTNTEKDLVDVLKYHIAVDQSGTRIYRNAAGQFHREEGPAVITAQGAVFWYQCGELHRVGGPAVIYSDGTEEWWQNGQLHRVGGPAITFVDCTVGLYIQGQRYSEDEYRIKVAELASRAL